MSSEVRVFVNAQPLLVNPGTTVGTAVARLDEALAECITAGTAYVTDGVGREIDPASLLEAGAIVRVVRGVPRSCRAKDRS